MAPSDRFFGATNLGGRLHVRGVPDWGPWNPERLEWADEEFLDIVLAKTPRDHKVGTPEELEAAIKEPLQIAPTTQIWIHESLLDEARRLWEQMAADLR